MVEHVPQELRCTSSSHSMPDVDEYVKTLGIQWNSIMDCFRLTVTELPPLERVTKRFLVSDVAKTFDVLGWFSPTIITIKILLQRLWEQKVDWDDTVPSPIQDVWLRWRSELNLLTQKFIPRYYFPKESHIISMELHGFCDASEAAYAGVVYFRSTDSEGRLHTSLITSKSKVAPIKKLTIPRLELCGALTLARLLNHLRLLYDIPLKDVYAWTDSTVVLNWIVGNPRRFKTFVGNRVSELVDNVPPSCWRHVNGIENPADCASRGLLPSELMDHNLWLNGPKWLFEGTSNRPKQNIIPVEIPEEEKLTCVSVPTIALTQVTPVVSFDRYLSYTKLKMVLGWIFRFTVNCRIPTDKDDSLLLI